MMKLSITKPEGFFALADALVGAVDRVHQTLSSNTGKHLRECSTGSTKQDAEMIVSSVVIGYSVGIMFSLGEDKDISGLLFGDEGDPEENLAAVRVMRKVFDGHIKSAIEDEAANNASSVSAMPSKGGAS